VGTAATLFTEYPRRPLLGNWRHKKRAGARNSRRFLLAN
jgi:hypothetical protein